jgi:L-lactate dehydrogenase complex protein LldG
MPGAFEATLSAHVDEPAVGVPLEGVGVSLAETGVTVDPTPAELKRARTGVTPVAFAIADYGSVVVPSTASGVELVSLFVDRHVAVLDGTTVRPNMEAAFELLADSTREGGGSSIVATGPSATADMGALVRGAHGPSDVRFIVGEDTHE